MYGQGLLKGLKVTGKHFFGKAITEQYPERMPNLPPRSHGSFHLEADKCNACGTCANWCPNEVISIDSVRGEDKKKRLTGYTMKLGYCLFCGLCVESCPKDALHTTSDFELSCYHQEDMSYVLFRAAEKSGEDAEIAEAVSAGS